MLALHWRTLAEGLVVAVLLAALAWTRADLNTAHAQLAAATASAQVAQARADQLVSDLRDKASTREAQLQAELQAATSRADAAEAQAKALQARVYRPLVVSHASGRADLAAAQLERVVTSTAVVALGGPLARDFEARTDAARKLVTLTSTHAVVVADLVARLPLAVEATDRALSALDAARETTHILRQAQQGCEDDLLKTTTALADLSSPARGAPPLVAPQPFWSMSITAGGILAVVGATAIAGITGYVLGGASPNP